MASGSVLNDQNYLMRVVKSDRLLATLILFDDSWAIPSNHQRSCHFSPISYRPRTSLRLNGAKPCSRPTLYVWSHEFRGPMVVSGQPAQQVVFHRRPFVLQY